MNKWIEKTCSISEIEDLLLDDEVEVHSPDGFVPVSMFVNKGHWEEFCLKLDDGRKIRVNENHLFETDQGWKYAKNIQNAQNKTHYQYLCDDGWHSGKISITGNKIPIVDIQVEHDNHRYYTNGVSSHNTGTGKSLFMCHMAAGCISAGKNVLYITMEMAEEKIAERIDANLLNITMDDLHVINKGDYERKFSSLKSKTHGKLIIKEYPTASAHAGHFRSLLNELKLKKNFVPDIVFIDYLNICCSSRIKQGGSVNSYTYVKAIAEELRGLAQEFGFPVMSATQTTRSGFCLDLNTEVLEKNKGKILLKNVQLGDELLSNEGFNVVKTIFPIEKKKVYKIITESGKEIICSENHIFPTQIGDKSILKGLKIGDCLMINDQNEHND